MAKVPEIQNTNLKYSKSLLHKKVLLENIPSQENSNCPNHCISSYVIPFLGTSHQNNTELTTSQIEHLKNIESKNPEDILYKKKLLSALGLNKKDTFLLSSIVGSSEFLDIAKKLDDNSNDPDIPCYAKGEGNKNIINYGYRANFHIHTKYSDGTIEVPNLLEQAAEYANQIVEKFGEGNYFHIAITDHDTAEGCEEALKTISSNVWKYRNLKVILGAEFSINRGHTVGLCLNPFDREIQNRYKTFQSTYHEDWKEFRFTDNAFYNYANKKSIIGVIAHPMIYYQMDKDNPKSLSSKMIKSFMDFKNNLKFAFVEGHCQRYNSDVMKTPEGKEYRKMLLQKAKEIGLFSIGGNDNHSRNVFNVPEIEYEKLLKHFARK